MTSSRRKSRLAAAMPYLPGLVPDGVEMEISGTVERVLHAGAARGYTEIIALIDGTVEAKICGRGDALSPGEQVDARGRWVPDPKYGRRFEAVSISARFPETTEGIVRYIAAGAVRGIGRQTAEKLAAHFGDRLPEMMTSPTSLIAAGIAEDKAFALSNHWTLRTRHGRALSVMFSHKIGEATAAKIIKKYGDGAPAVVAQDPYRLAGDIKGVGFKKADAIALSQGGRLDAPARIRAGLRHVAGSTARDGDCCLPRERLVVQAADLLKLPEREVRKEEEGLIRDGLVIVDHVGGQEVVYPAEMHACEEEVADRITARLGRLPLGDAVDALIEAAATEVGFRLHEHQHEAVRVCLENRVAVVTGGPGTGKTATLKTVIAALRAIEPNIRLVLTAPTGRAAQRIAESTGHPASTIHLALGARGGDGFLYNADNPIPADAFVVDESSMIDIWMMRSILRALPEGARLILIGDADQLPSVGPGNVFADIIESRVLKVARLTKVFRQGDGSDIAVAAAQVRQGFMPKLTKPCRSSDNWTVSIAEPAEAIQKLLRLHGKVLPDLGFDPIDETQVITPGHNNEVGAANLNRVLQEILNPAAPGKAEIDVKGTLLRRGDKVMHTSNDKELGVYNGNIGRILDLSTAGRPRMLVSYDGHEVVYDKSDMDVVKPAWAITVHKSQGSENKVIVPIVTTQHYILLRRNLFYTALTRARLLCCTIAQNRALAIAVRTEGSRRLTGLAQRLAARSFGTAF